MVNTLKETAPLDGDGTSRFARAPAALAADSVGIDEWGIAERLAFARAIADRLIYYDEANQPAGSWAGLFEGIGSASGLSFEEVAAFLKQPEAFPGERYATLRRPHVMLLLAFLQLFETARDAINGLTGRHLDFYYQRVLRLRPKPPVPDRAFVLFQPAIGVDVAEVPAGTRLFAGRDTTGRERIYRTERPLLVSRASIERISSVFADKQIITIADARTAVTGTKEERFLNMLRLALGDPEPGDPLPAYGDGQPIDFPRLLALADLVAFAPRALFLEIFEVRKLVTLKRRRDGADEEWRAINAILQTAGQRKRRNPAWRLVPADARDFTANLALALEGMPSFAGLPEVDSVDDLYVQRYRADVRQAIGTLLLLSEAEFVRMMDIKRRIDADWKVINALLEEAGRRRRGDPRYQLAVTNPADFRANFQSALGVVSFSSVGASDIDSYFQKVEQIEEYFFMSAENFARVMATGAKAEAATSAKEWEAVYAILGQAHAQKVYAGRRQALTKVRLAAANQAEGLRAMLLVALGVTTAADTATLLDQLADFVSAADMATLRTIAADAERGAVGEARWQEAADILERAQRKRERLPPPQARKVEWLNLFAFEDATTVVVGPPSAAGDEYPRFKPFGRRPQAEAADAPPPETIGFAVASPLFQLSAGARRIVVTLGLHRQGTAPFLEQGAAPPFTVRVSTAKGWIEPQAVALEEIAYGTLDGIAPLGGQAPLAGLKLTIDLPADAAAIAPPPPGEALAGCPWPVIKVMLRQVWNPGRQRFETAYARFRSVRVARVHVRAAVGGLIDTTNFPDAPGLAPLLLENDVAPLDGKKPFEPFGVRPAVGSRLAATHPDLLNKSLRSLRFRLEWMNGPSNLAQRYAAYGIAPAFQVRISIVDSGVRTREIRSNAPLFTGNDATKPHTIAIANIADPPVPYALPDGGAAPAAARGWRRFLQWELSPLDFQHAVYPSLVTRKSLELAAAVANLAAGKINTAIDASAYAVEAPYTPKLKTLSLDFVAGHEVLMDRYRRGPETDQIYHIHPFGAVEAEAVPSGQGFPLLPNYDNEGELYIGIRGVRPPQTFSLLFQLAEGSGEATVDRSQLGWSYLAADGWQSLAEGGIIDDQTRGLVNSGIIEFRLPAGQPADGRLPADLYWLRATMAENTRAVCDVVAIHAHAAAARFVDAGNAADHYRAPLPPGTIKALVDPLPAIARVRQPYSSFGGKPEENAADFATRVSERLRHKQRAITLWDYERLVLERFPEIYKVKCLPASLADDGGAGGVRVVVIPNIRDKHPADPFEPRAPADLLMDIEAFLRPLMPPSARLSVHHPAYVQVRVRVGVRFRTPGNEGFYKQRLSEELNRYLSPWAYDDGADIAIGQRIYANSIVTFIDERPYVDFVAGIKLFSSTDGVTFTLAAGGEGDGEFVSAGRADGVLVAARQHEIDIIPEEIFKQEEFTGINYMKIELDFIVG